MTDASTPPEEGTCQTCGAVFRVNKDRTLRHHNGPSRTYGVKRCDGAGKLPLETMPVEADTLEVLVRGIVREASKLQEYQRATFVSQRILRRIGPRLRQLQGENAMLRDAVIGAKELVFEETPERERGYAEESLHTLAEELLEQNPHLRRPKT